MKRIYMDNNATTAVRPTVLEAMLPFYQEQFGNPSSIHWAGQSVNSAVEAARAQVAQLISCQPEEILFTSCGSEGNALAIKGSAEFLHTKGNHIITTAVEHPAVLNSCKYLEKQGFEVTVLAVDGEGMIDLAALEAAICERTILISVMWGNNETGTLFPVSEIGAIARKHKVRFHTDAVQAVGRVPIDVPGIIGLGVACELAGADLVVQDSRIRALRDRLEQGILSRISEVQVNGHRQQRLPNTLNISFAYIEGEAILLFLDMKGVAASSGSACMSDSFGQSHVIGAMGVDPMMANSNIRFGLGLDNTEEDVDFVLEILPEIIQKLRDMSPFYSERAAS